MTAIAWDGKTLAADKQATFAGLGYTVTKIFRIGLNKLVSISGDGVQGMDMLQWYKSGRDPDKFPAAQRDKDQWVSFAVFTKGELGKVTIEKYERTPYPITIEEEVYADGSGRDYALTALYLGKTAKEAVEIACHFDVNCGCGIDTLQF